MREVVLEGQLSGHPFVEVLQLAVGKRQPLKIELLDAAQLFGEVYLDGPLLIEARVDQLRGLHALSAMLRLSEGSFRVVHERCLVAGSLQLSLDDALFDCARLEDEEPNEARKTLSSMPPFVKA